MIFRTMKKTLILIGLLVSIQAISQTPTYRYLGGSQNFNAQPKFSKSTPGPRQGASSFMDTDGNFWLYGGFGHDLSGQDGYFNDTWKYDRNAEIWTWVDGQMTGDRGAPDYNNSLSFDGIDDYVQLVSSPLNYNSDLTIELWFKPTQDGAIISHIPDDIGSSSAGWRVEIVNNGESLMIVRDQGWVQLEANSLNLLDGNWHHVAVTWKSGDNIFGNGSDYFVQDKLTLIIDDVEYSVERSDLVNESFPPTGHVTSFGVFRGGNNEFFYGGLIDEVRFWDYARSYGEIIANKYIQLEGTEDGLAAYYDFNQGKANSSGNSDAIINDKAEKNITGERNPEIYRNGLFIGEITKMRVWSKGLSGDEVREIRHNAVDGTELDLAMAYQFDNGNSTITPNGDNTTVSSLTDLTTGDDGFLNNFDLQGDNSNFREDAFPVIPYHYPTSSNGTGVVTADLNGDTYPDIIRSNGNNNSIEVLINDQSGKFGSATSHDFGSRADDLTTVFWNDDNFPDIAVTGISLPNDYIRIFISDGIGGFSSTTDINLPQYATAKIIRSADFNGDTNDDLVVVLLEEKRFEIHYGDGFGNVASVASFDLGYTHLNERGILIEDFNNDTYPDLAFTLVDDVNTFCGQIGIFINDQTGAFPTPEYASTQCLTSVSLASGDYNNNGYKDIYVMDGSYTYIVQNFGDGTFGGPIFNWIDVDHSPGFTVSDFNSDGVPDIIANRKYNLQNGENYSSLAIYTGDVSGNFELADEINILSQIEDLAVADFDQNGIMDVVSVTSSQTFTSVVLRGGNLFSQPTKLPTLDFDGEDDHITIPNLKVFDSNFSIEGWVKTEDNGPIFSFGSTDLATDFGAGEFAFTISGTNQERIGLMLDPNVYGYNDFTRSTNFSIKDGQWHHLAMTVFINPAGSETIILYVDGLDIGTITGIDFDADIDNANAGFSAKIGIVKNNFGSDYLDGTGLAPKSNFVSGLPFPDDAFGRAYAAEWSDGVNNYVFGGEGANGVYNTLRAFNTQTESWSIIKGSTIPGDAGNYGIINVSDPNNNPPARWIVDGAQDPSGKFWVFGGAATQNPITWYNDLWMYDPINNEWTWKGGSTLLDQLPVYGTKGVGATTNIPGARENNALWSDSNGDLWLFGGYGLDANGDVGFLNDLWKYNIVTQEWTWIAGSNLADQAGVYGELGVAEISNYPGGRAAPVQWIDSQGIVWIHGGQGVDKFGLSLGYLNDLWSYDPINNLWTWHSGQDFRNSTGTYDQEGLSSTDYSPGARWHGSEWIDEEDNLWLFGGYKVSPNFITTGRYNDLWKYEPPTSEWTWISGLNTTARTNQVGEYGDIDQGSKPFPGARHGGLMWTDNNGDFWILGGNNLGTSQYGNLTDLWKYESSKKEWNYIRGNTSLDTGDGTYGALGIGNPANEPQGRWHGASWVGEDNKLWLFGGLTWNKEVSRTGWLNDLWVYDPASDVFTWMGGSSGLDPAGSYGDQGIPSTANFPPAKSSGAFWKDEEGNFWVFGGYANFDYNNDLWKFNPNTLEWTWVNGNKYQNTPGIYGTKGVEAPTNQVGARRYTDSWIDKDGYVWIFGGEGYDVDGQLTLLNDLWRYNPVSNKWAWMSGSKQGNLVGSYGTKGVPHPDNMPPPRYAHTTWTDDSGNLWLLGGYGIFGSDNATSVVRWLNDLWKYDIKTNLWTWIDGSGPDLILDPVYGTQGVFDENNIIMAHERAHKFETTNKSLFLFGGRQSRFQSQNDFWEIRFTPGETFIADPSVINQTGFEFEYDEPWATSFQLQVALSSDFSDTFLDLNQTTKSASITGLSAGTIYYYRINAINDIGESGFGATKSTLTRPATPEFESLSLAVTDITSTTVNINWLTTTGILDGYEIDISTDPTFTDETKFVTNYNKKAIAITTSEPVSGLQPGTRYYIRLRSFNNSGFSSYSQVVPFLTTPESPIFDPAESVSDIGQTTITITWNAVSEILDGYRMTVSTDETFSDATQILIDYNSRPIQKSRVSIPIQGLTPGTQYYAYLTAFNSSGQSEPSNTISILTLPESPVFPLDGSIITSSQTSARIAWEAPNELFDGYKLEISTEFSFNNSTLLLDGYGRGGNPKLIDKTILDEEILNLNPGQRYFARIRSYNASGDSPNSNIIEIVTVPPAPTFDAPGNITQNSASLSWSTITGITYLIDLNTSQDFNPTTAIFTEFPLAVSYQVLSDLTPGTRYYARVQSSNVSGNSGQMDPPDFGFTNFITVPGTPVLNGVDAYTQTSFTISWPAVEGAVGYEVDVSDNFFQTFLVGFNGTTLTEPTITVNNLDPGSEYQIRVRARNVSGKSPNAGIFDLLTLPETPIARDATNSSASVFTANWDPADGADYYVLEVSTDDFATFHYNEQLSSSNPVQITNLSAGTTYKYRVKSGNASGESPYSNAVTVIAQNTAQSLNISSLTYNDEFGENATSAVINVKFTGGSGNPNVTIRHKEILSSNWSAQKPMTEISPTEFEFTILSNMLDDIGVVFEIYADDGITFIKQLNNTIKRTFSETNSESLPPLILGEWSMISIPYVLEDNLVTSIFNELGDLAYKKKWRLMTYLDSEYQDQGVGFTRIDLGRGYWFNSLNDVEINVGAGQTNSTIPFEMALNQGWNQIGNPYNVDINWDRILDDNSLPINISKLIIYDPADKEFKESSTLSSFQGAFVFADQAAIVAVNPAATSTTGREISNEQLFEGLNWKKSINLEWGGKAREVAAIGMHDAGKMSKDQFDQLVIPRFENYLEMYTTDDSYFYPRFTRDIKSHQDEYVWHFDLESNFVSGYTTLQWDASLLERGYLWLVDEDAGRIVKMDDQHEYLFNFNEKHEFSIHYSTNPNYKVVPSKLTLGDAYPNPINSLAYIPVFLPERDQPYDLKLNLFDLQGKLVKTIAAGEFRTGVHVFELDINNDIVLKDGLYFYKVSFDGDHSNDQQKKIFIRR